jgi:GNAT superfamily N-acetyltransferase
MQADTDLRPVRLSTLPPGERERLLRIYEATVYGPAFPDAEIREDPGYWLGLLGADPYPPPPQPRIEVILLIGAGDFVAGGATIELYRTADCGLLTYLSIHADRRGQGLGKRLIGEARAALAQMAGGPRPVFAETERLEDARTADARAATMLRQTQLARLGARLVGFDYWMPPLRPGLPAHQLHLALIGEAGPVAAARVAALIAELAGALGANLDDHAETRAMMAALAGLETLPLSSLPAAGMASAA